MRLISLLVPCLILVSCGEEDQTFDEKVTTVERPSVAICADKPATDSLVYSDVRMSCGGCDTSSQSTQWHWSDAWSGYCITVTDRLDDIIVVHVKAWDGLHGVKRLVVHHLNDGEVKATEYGMREGVVSIPIVFDPETIVVHADPTVPGEALFNPPEDVDQMFPP